MAKLLEDDSAYDARDEWAYDRQDEGERIGRSDSKEFCKQVVSDMLATDTEPGQVVSIYGIGGQGKTHMLLELYAELLERRGNEVVVVLHGFEEDGDSTTETILKKIAELVEAHGISCPSFWISYYAYRALSSNLRRAEVEFAEDCERRSAYGTLDLLADLADYCAPFVDFLFPAVAPSSLPVGSMLATTLDRANKLRTIEATDKAKRRWRLAMGNADPKELQRSLPDRLREDIERWVGAAQGRRLVVFLDTFEKLGWGSGRSRSRYEWARRLSRARGSLWVIAGRMRVPWGNVLQYPMQLVEMTHEEADELLEYGGVTDKGMRAAIEELTGRLPVYLSICVSLLKEDPTLTPRALREFGDREGLPDLYLRNLGESVSVCAYCLSFLEHWDIGFAQKMLDGVVPLASLDAVNRISFIHHRDGRWEIHEVVADILRRSCDHEMTKLRLYERALSVKAEVDADRDMPQSSKANRTKRLLRVLNNLADAGVSGLGREGEFKIHMAYAESVWHYGDLEMAQELFSSVAERFDVGDIPSRETLFARLKVAALDTQNFLMTGEGQYHQDAINETERILALVEEHYPDDEGLMATVLNDLGVSYSRFGRYHEAMDCQERFVGDILARDSATYTKDEARYLNNYGSTCQQMADNSNDDATKSALYSQALTAYEASYAARAAIGGKESSGALVSYTNIGVVHARMGNDAEAERIFKEAINRYKDAGYEKDYPGYLRCSFQLGILERVRAERCIARGDADALAHAKRALRLQEKTYNARAASTTEYSVDARKSADELSRCRGLVKAIEQLCYSAFEEGEEYEV